MIIITGTIEMHPEDAWAASGAALKMMEASEQEDGCITYRVYTDIMVPRRFRIYEEWRDEASLAAHFNTPHMAEFQSKISTLRVLDRKLKKFWVETEAPL